ncbi:hypothetical protein KBY96_04050 [Cyanobium sp. ATX 6A2]|uniref:SGNH/GDSL hydrolase family protein n=1 Tax=Cyanobium sp. ATX 6A2 TaxID=2823700 RepID=UPI0020CB795F|nr:SGNH/GDSL hydrolase family protein [Cyanobium sp. ATX 6A2]MCP9887105.1 hypothetical protein [Cyanobium sp. ATX 6A2]
MSFRVRFSRSVVREGRSLRTQVRAPRDLQGQLLYWRLRGNGVKRTDFSDGRLNGVVQIGPRGLATITHLIRADGRQEGNQKVGIEFFSDQSRRRNDRVAQGSFVIRDSNQSSEPSPRKPGYTLVFSRSEIGEGSIIRARINAPRRLSGNELFWKLDGDGITGDDISNAGLKGNVEINRRGRGVIRLETRVDNRLEGTENSRLQLFSDRKRTDILARSSFRILDTSKPSPAPQPTPPTPPPPSSTVERLNIMAMGDSITVGFGSEEQAGYRQPLKDRLTGKPYSVSFVGKFGSDLKHWGRTGALISEDRDPITGETYVALRQNSGSRLPFKNTLAPDITEAISPAYFSRNSTTKNVLLLTIGTNDFSNQVVSSKYGAVTSGDLGNDALGEQQDKLGDTIYQRLRSLLTRINNAAKNNGLSLDLLLGTIPTQLESSLTPDRPASSITRSEISQYNTLIKQTLNSSTAYSNLEIAVVDQFSAIGVNLRDGIHPTAQGYNAMASAWLQGIEANVLA